MITSTAVLIEPTHLRQLFRQGGGEIGDCFRTVIACMVGANDPTLVPHFVADTINAGLDDSNGNEDIAAARRWLRTSEGLDLMLVDRSQANQLGVPYLLTVRSTSGAWNHAVLAQYGVVQWCPSGGRYAIEDAVDELALILVEPYDPDPDELLAIWQAWRVDEVADRASVG